MRAIAIPDHQRYACPMTNRIAIGLGLFIAILLIADFALQNGAGSLFLARKMSELVNFLAFWR